VPGSDLDVMLVHNGRHSTKEMAAIADAVWYPVWDSGYGLDHSVRTVKEALSIAEADLKTALGLLDGRFVAGDETLAADLVDKAMVQWQRYGRRRIEALASTVEKRHLRFGEVAFLLEPDLKEGRGGLRDIQALRAGALISPVVDGTDPALMAAGDVLLTVRIELQRTKVKEQNLLLLQDQDAVAAALAYADADDLMAAVSAAGRTIAWASDDGWRRVRSWLVGPGRRGSADRPLGRVSCSGTGRWRWRPMPTSPIRRWPCEPACSRPSWARRWRGRPSTAWRPRRQGPAIPGPRRAAPRWWGCWDTAPRPCPCSRRWTRRVCWCACCRSGSRCAAGRSATPITASPSTGTCGRRP